MSSGEMWGIASFVVATPNGLREVEFTLTIRDLGPEDGREPGAIAVSPWPGVEAFIRQFDMARQALQGTL